MPIDSDCIILSVWRATAPSRILKFVFWKILISCLLVKCSRIDAPCNGYSSTNHEQAFRCIHQKTPQSVAVSTKTKAKNRTCNLHFCQIRYEFSNVTDPLVMMPYAEAAYGHSLLLYGNETMDFDDKGYCWFPQKMSLCPVSQDYNIPILDNEFYCNFDDCNNGTLMNSIYSNSSTISDEILKSTILKIKKTACFLTVDPNYKNPETGIFDTVCSACKSYGLEYDGCDHTTFKDDPTPKWQTPVIISIVLVPSILFFVYAFHKFNMTCLLKRLRSSTEEIERHPLVPVSLVQMDNFSSSYDYEQCRWFPDEIYVVSPSTQGSNGYNTNFSNVLKTCRLLETDCMEMDCLINAEKMAKLDIFNSWKKVENENKKSVYISEDIFLSENDPITLHEIIEEKIEISMWRAVKMMQSVVSGFHDVSSNRIRTFFNQLKSNCETSGSNRYINHASLMQVTPRNFVFDRNYILADQIDEPDLNCWVKFILNPKQLNSKSSDDSRVELDISSEQIYLYENLVDDAYPYLLYKVKLILGLILQLTNAKSSSILAFHPYQELMRLINNRSHDSVVSGYESLPNNESNLQFQEIISASQPGGFVMIKEFKLESKFHFLYDSFTIGARDVQEIRPKPRPRYLFGLEEIIQSNGQNWTEHLSKFDDNLWSPDHITFDFFKNYLDDFEDFFYEEC